MISQFHFLFRDLKGGVQRPHHCAPETEMEALRTFRHTGNGNGRASRLPAHRKRKWMRSMRPSAPETETDAHPPPETEMDAHPTPGTDAPVPEISLFFRAGNGKDGAVICASRFSLARQPVLLIA